jgi:putative hydrolase
MKNNFMRFKEISHEFCFTDKHLHSTWSDGEGSVQQLIDRAKQCNISSIAVTDHLRKTSTYFFDSKAEVERLQKMTDIQVLSGFEAKVDDFNGNIDVADDVLAAADIKIVSVHRFPIGRNLYAANFFDAKIAQEIELELCIAAVNRGGFNVLGHPGGMSLTAHKDFSEKYFEEIVKACLENNIAFDFNGRYHWNIAEMLISLFEKYNPLISIGSDSHKLDAMGAWNKFLAKRLCK